MKKKKILTIAALLFFSCLSIGQIDKTKILTSEDMIPESWQDSLIKKSKWVLIQVATVVNGKVKEINDVINKNRALYFQKDSIRMLPFKIDTIKELGIIYFQQEKTFYASAMIQHKDKSYSEEKIGYKLLYLNGNNLVLEEFWNGSNAEYFDYTTGKILSDE